MAPAWRARPDGEPPACVDGALRQLHWEHIWDAWEAEAGVAHSSSEQLQEQARLAAITPRGRPFWRVGQPLESGRRRGGATVAQLPGGDSGWAAQQATVLALVRSQAERWFALLRDENAALRDENSALKADIQAAQATPSTGAASMQLLPPASPAPRLPAASRPADAAAGRLGAPAELVPAADDVGRRRSSEGGPFPAQPASSFAAHLFASIGQCPAQVVETPEDDETSSACCEEEGGDGDGEGLSLSARSHSSAAALSVCAQQRSDMHTCRVAAATCASSMAALTDLLHLRWGPPEDDATVAAPRANAPSVASSTAGAAGSAVGGKGCVSDDEGEEVIGDSASLCGSDTDGDLGSPRSSVSQRTASLAHLASLRNGAAAAAAAVVTSLQSSCSLRGGAHPEPRVEPGLPANANAAGEAAQAAVRELAEALHKAQGDANVRHWASAAAACATAGDSSVCAPALAVPMWQMMALSSAAETAPGGGHGGGEVAAAPAPVLAYPSDYWQTSSSVDAHLRTMAPPMDDGIPIALVACDIVREDSAEFASADGGLTADECDDDDSDGSVLGDAARSCSVSVADAAAAHDEAAAAVAAALARVSTLPTPLELAAACAREVDG